MSQAWHLFTGSAEPRHITLPAPPPWRTFSEGKQAAEQAGAADEPVPLPDADDHYWDRARAYCTPPVILDAVNAALALRRPLLVTGKPGTGKSSLAYRIAYELGLGPVLVWPVNSRSTLKEGLYDYDAIARLQDHQFNNQAQAADIGRYITLRALGTALLPRARPRVLLIDELDKADPDLPNDLLNVFEEGWFDIPELQRHTEELVTVRVTTTRDGAGDRSEAAVRRGRVQCREFPFIVVTNNGEREFSPAFLRRCVQVELPDPGTEQLTAIVSKHLGENVAAQARDKIAEFAAGSAFPSSTDQLLNSLYIVHQLNGASARQAIQPDA